MRCPWLMDKCIYPSNHQSFFNSLNLQQTSRKKNDCNHFFIGCFYQFICTLSTTLAFHPYFDYKFNSLNKLLPLFKRSERLTLKQAIQSFPSIYNITVSIFNHIIIVISFNLALMTLCSLITHSTDQQIACLIFSSDSINQVKV